MSTRSQINVKLINDTSFECLDGEFRTFPRDTYVSIYCHFDGYTRWVGDKLLTYYNTYDSALQLIRHGNISCINEDGSVDAYFNRGEDFDISSSDEPLREEYTYVFENGKWYVDDGKELTRELIESDY